MLLIKHAQYTLSIFLFALQEWWNAMGSCTLSTVADFQRSIMSFWTSPFYCNFIIISRNQYKRLVSLPYHQLLSTLSFHRSIELILINITSSSICREFFNHWSEQSNMFCIVTAHSLNSIRVFGRYLFTGKSVSVHISTQFK